MGGEILDYPAKAARREGLAEGIESTLALLVKDGILTESEAKARKEDALKSCRKTTSLSDHHLTQTKTGDTV